MRYELILLVLINDQNIWKPKSFNLTISTNRVKNKLSYGYLLMEQGKTLNYVKK